jgi:hypothetical protein
VNLQEKVGILAFAVLFGAFVIVLTFGDQGLTPTPRQPISGPSCPPNEGNRQQSVAQEDVRNGWRAESKKSTWP